MSVRVPTGHWEGDHVLVEYPDGTRTVVSVFGQPEFLAERWSYRAGEHATFLGMTGSGKTWLMYQLAQITATPALPAYALITKPRPRNWDKRIPIDQTHRRWLDHLGWPVLDNYPPPMHRRWAKPSGYGLWPWHDYDPKTDDPRLYEIMRRTLLDRYKYGRSILIVDEGLDMQDLKLHDEMRVLHTRGRGGGTGVWEGSQAPVEIGTWAYTQATHLFSGNIPDRRYQQRLDEISGMDVGLYRAVVRCVPKHGWAYARQRGRVICAIAPPGNIDT